MAFPASKVSIHLTPHTTSEVAHTGQRYDGSLKQYHRTTPERERMLDFDQLNAVIGTPELLELGRRYDG